MVTIKKSNQLDFILLGTVGFLLAIGILILASASAPLAQERFGTPYYYLNHQIIFGLIPGLILAFLAFRIRLDFLKKWSPVLLLINLLLLAMVFLPGIGHEFGGATRWIDLGPISFQPSEFLKPIFIIYLAVWLTSRTSRQNKSGFKQTEKGFSTTLIAFSIVIGLISLLLISQPNISTLVVIILVAIIMYFLANTPLWHSILIILIGAVGLISLIKLAPYRMERLLVFLRPETDLMGIGYQMKQALIAVGSGGILGLGLGMSRQKFGFLPHAISDSIFPILAEETGFIGGIILIFLFLLFLWRGIKIVKEARDQFCQLTALGITSWIVIQAFVNISAMIGILPLTGIPLPFISHGGSALIATLTGTGILLNISKNTS